MRVGLIPSDARQRAVAAAFESKGIEIVWIKDGREDVDIRVLPMPVSEDGVTFYGSEIQLRELFSVWQGQRVFGGRCSGEVARLAAQYDVTILDHFLREEEVILNGIPTLEGALQIAMEQTPFTLHGSRVLVCGFGRIGKLLARALEGLGAKVTVSARRPRDFAWCKALGYTPVHSDRLTEWVGEMDVIFNTVPHLLFNGSVLDALRPQTLVIDLASAPGGVDFAYAATTGKKAIQALGLPGKVAPRTAGEIICETILTMYSED